MEYKLGYSLICQEVSRPELIVTLSLRKMTSSMEVQGLHMREGDGETSYAKNSQVQGRIMSIAKPIIEEAIRECYSMNCKKSFAIADLGCSSGPNTLLLASGVISIVEGICLHFHRPIPEFQVYLNDLPGNDFNTLFKSLPVLYEKMKREEEKNSIPCFIAAVPGSFYGRLFPSNSLDFVHSSSSLHWLSQAPVALGTKGNGILNEGHVQISETSPASVVNAYVEQFRRDCSQFLRSRSEEIVAGGRMVLTFFGRSTKDATASENCIKFDLISKGLNELVLQGVIEKEEVDSFNIPLYEASIDEVMQEIEREGSFLPHHREACTMDWPAIEGVKLSESMAKMFLSVFYPLLHKQFGDRISTEESILERAAEVLEHFPMEKAKFTVLIISLIRKG